MIYLTTGANGAGKTLLTLRDVREKSVKESRPVAYNGRFEMVANFGWKKIDAKDWEAEPDGTIFLFDECHNDFPIRPGKDAAPQYVRMLAEHRRRGFDFYLITQHPLNIDAFLRRLIGSPGWHRHLKRASGAPLVSVLEWPSVNQQCEKAGAGESGSVSMVPYPKEVYDWYKSTSLDTAKLRVPFRVWFLLVAALAVPLAGYFAYSTFTGANASREAKIKKMAGPTAAGPLGAASGVVPRSTGGPAGVAGPVTAAEYLASFSERVVGLAYTSPRYDAITQPVRAPFPAACVQSSKRCECYSQEGTRLQVQESLCKQIVANGFFQDWGVEGSGTSALPPAPAAAAPVAPVVSSGGGGMGAAPAGPAGPSPVRHGLNVSTGYGVPDVDADYSVRDREVLAFMNQRRVNATRP